MPTPKKSTPVQKAEVDRPLLHPEIAVETCVGDNAITADRAKELLGWQIESEAERFKDDYLLMNDEGQKVRCLNNTRNRPLSEAWCRTLSQDILNKNWADSRNNGDGRTTNGEAIIIGKYGQVLSGQHRLIGLIFSEEQRVGKQKNHWEALWPEQVSIEAIMVFGVDESTYTTRTLDCVKSRTAADVLFASGLFGKVPRSKEAKLAKMCDYAIRMLWHRVGADQNAFRRFRTNSEVLDWLERHPRIVRSVKHVFEEEKEGEKAISRWIAPGTASGLLYLMGSSSSDVDEYSHAEPPSEKVLNWDNWERACDFWVELSSGTPEFKEVRYALAGLRDSETGKGGTMAEKVAIIAKAWLLYADKKPIDARDLELAYHVDEEGGRHLKECPVVGGIDLGDPKGSDESDDDDDAPSPVDDAHDEDESNAENAIPKAAATTKGKAPSHTTAEQEKEAREKRINEVREKLLKNRQQTQGTPPATESNMPVAEAPVNTETPASKSGKRKANVKPG